MITSLGVFADLSKFNVNLEDSLAERQVEVQMSWSDRDKGKLIDQLRVLTLWILKNLCMKRLCVIKKEHSLYYLCRNHLNINLHTLCIAGIYRDYTHKLKRDISIGINKDNVVWDETYWLVVVFEMNLLPTTASYFSEELLESENNQQIENVANKVSTLKHVRQM